MTRITLLHTSPAHLAPFETLAARIAPDVDLVQIVRQDWLAEARANGLHAALVADVVDTVKEAGGTVICTCTSIGAAAETAGAIRIDAPMMAEAAQIGGPVLLVYALRSTQEASTDLLQSALDAAQSAAPVVPLFLGEFWPLFEAGEVEAFAACIAGAVRHAAGGTRVGSVVLAQASMAPAAVMLHDLGVPVLTSPESALVAAMAR